MTQIAFVAIFILFLAFLGWRERAHADERRELTQRIQAPERAVAAFERERAPRERVPARAISPDDDEAMAEAIEERERRAGDGRSH